MPLDLCCHVRHDSLGSLVEIEYSESSDWLKPASHTTRAGCLQSVGYRRIGGGAAPTRFRPLLSLALALLLSFSLSLCVSVTRAHDLPACLPASPVRRLCRRPVSSSPPRRAAALMVTVLNFETVQAVATMMRQSYLSQAVLFVFVVVMLRHVVAAWSSSLAPLDVQVCPPVNPNVHYPYGVSQMQGRRPYMEDRHTAHADLNGDATQSFYGVFDGHGGDGAANYCVQAMCQNVIREPSFAKQPVEALKKGFVKTDQEYLKIANKRNSEDGTTAVAVLTRGDSIYVAHAGDSRAILVHSSGKVTALTSDHKPNRPDERKRIQELGGSVVFWGVWRVEGILAVSRAIGDRMLKPFVVAEPEVKEWTRTANDRFLIVASDGVWDTISNDDAAELTMKHDDPQVAAKHLMEEAYARGSLDNICVMVIDLRDEKKVCTTKSN